MVIIGCVLFCQVVPNHKETYKHLMWHCMIYRKALGNVPSGYQVLRATLQEMKNEDPCCVGCEEDDISKKIKNMGLKEVCEIICLTSYGH